MIEVFQKEVIKRKWNEQLHPCTNHYHKYCGKMDQMIEDFQKERILHFAHSGIHACRFPFCPRIDFIHHGSIIHAWTFFPTVNHQYAMPCHAMPLTYDSLDSVIGVSFDNAISPFLQWLARHQITSFIMLHALVKLRRKPLDSPWMFLSQFWAFVLIPQLLGIKKMVGLIGLTTCETLTFQLHLRRASRNQRSRFTWRPWRMGESTKRTIGLPRKTWARSKAFVPWRKLTRCLAKCVPGDLWYMSKWLFSGFKPKLFLWWKKASPFVKIVNGYLTERMTRLPKFVQKILIPVTSIPQQWLVVPSHAKVAKELNSNQLKFNY